MDVRQTVAVATYLGAIVLANLIVQNVGAWTLPINAFLLIGLDLSLRDYLHDIWMESLALKMGLLILSGAVITWLIQPEAGWVAIASVSAFTGAAIADTAMYHCLREWEYLWRANGSNIIGAFVDSTLFPTIAFGMIMPWTILGQFVAKVFGGAFWAWIIDRVGWREVAVSGCLLFGGVSVAQAQDLYVTSHYDVRRQQPIMALVHDTPLPGKFFSTGYVEVWRNSERVGYPGGEWTLFSKHWITYPLTKRLSVSAELSFMLNRPGVAFQWPKEAVFQPGDRSLYFTPKIGLSYQIY